MKRMVWIFISEIIMFFIMLYFIFSIKDVYIVVTYLAIRATLNDILKRLEKYGEELK